MLVAQSCPTLCDPMEGSPPGSSVHGLSRQEHWNELPLPSPGDLPDPGSPGLQADSLGSEPPGKPICRGCVNHGDITAVTTI